MNFVWVAEGRNNKTNTSKHGTVRLRVRVRVLGF